MLRRPTIPQRRAFTLLEAVLLTVILSIVAIGAGVGLQSAAHVPEGADNYLAIHSRLVEKMEDLASMDFTTLSTNTGLSDTVTINNQVLPRTVTVSKFDGNGDGTLDSDIVEVTVAIGSRSLKTRVSQP